MNTKKTNLKRKRRTKKTLENDLLNAFEEQIIEKGFNNITITGLAQAAKVEPPVIYNRFNNIDELLDKYVRKYDYWFNDLVHISPKDYPKQSLKKIFSDLIEGLYQNEIIQKILLWELTDSNETTYRTATNRESQTQLLIKYLKQKTECTSVELEPLIALILGGIYYIVLQKKKTNFCNIDFNTEEGKRRLIAIVDNLVDKFFVNKISSEEERKRYSLHEIVKNLVDNGVDEKIIESATGVSLKEINAIMNAESKVNEVLISKNDKSVYILFQK